jgi:hypothetical protein
MTSINIPLDQPWFNTPNQNVKEYSNTLFSKNIILKNKSIKGIITKTNSNITSINKNNGVFNL